MEKLKENDRLEEHIFFENEEILISSTRLVIGNKTIVTDSICSIDLDLEELRPPWVAISLIVIGLFIGVFSIIPDIGWTIAIFGAAYAILSRTRKRKDALVIELGSGDYFYITNREVKDLTAIHKVINDVIIFRG